MKTLIPTVLIFLASTVAVGQNDIGTVKKIQTLEVYILSEPVAEYEEVFTHGEKVLDAGSRLNLNSAMGGKNTIDDKVNNLVNTALKKAKKKKEEINGLIYTSGTGFTAIKFTGESEGKAKVSNVMGRMVFIMCEPDVQYSIALDKVFGGSEDRSAQTAGLMSDKIEEDVAEFVKKATNKAKRKNVEFDGVLYSSWKKAIAISF